MPISHVPAHVRRGLTLTEIAVIVLLAAILAGIFTLMLPSMWRRPGGLSPRNWCASNLKAIGMGLYTYANENRDMFPIALHAPADQDGIGKIAYAPKKTGVKRTGVYGRASAPSEDNPAAGGSTVADTELSTTRNLWLLVRSGASTPKSFICPNSHDDSPNDEDNPQDFYDFREYSEVSYGYQVPYGRKGQPSPDLDQRMPLAADKGPYGAALEAGKSDPGVPNIPPTATPDEWMNWNSLNHGGEGQVVLFADSHAEFLTNPTCGIDKDNIYNRWTGPAGHLKANESARAHGVPPTGRETPWSDTDTLIYP